MPQAIATPSLSPERLKSRSLPEFLARFKLSPNFALRGRITMGNPPTPQESAPAYDDVFHDHPVNQFPATGSASAYASVPQDDVEMQPHIHNHTSPNPAPAQQETLAQTIAGVFRPTSHEHCKQCDVQLEARERRANDKHCCTMVAATFMVGFVCFLLFGIVLTGTIAKARRHAHD